MGKKNHPIDLDVLAAEVAYTAEELNRLMALAHKEGLKIHLTALGKFLVGREDYLPQVKVGVLRRRTN